MGGDIFMWYNNTTYTYTVTIYDYEGLSCICCSIIKSTMWYVLDLIQSKFFTLKLILKVFFFSNFKKLDGYDLELASIFKILIMMFFGDVSFSRAFVD